MESCSSGDATNTNGDHQYQPTAPVQQYSHNIELVQKWAQEKSPILTVNHTENNNTGQPLQDKEQQSNNSMLLDPTTSR